MEGVEGQIEELKTEKESMKGLLDKTSREMNELKLLVKKLEVKNLEMQMEVTELRRELQEVKSTAANDQVQIGRMKSRVFTMQFNYEAMEEKLQLLHPKSKSNGTLAKRQSRCVRD